jgi:hypothetical protein
VQPTVGLSDRGGVNLMPFVPLEMLQMEEDFIQANPEWVKELEIMATSKVKAEIQALSSFGFQYLSQVSALSPLLTYFK